jgi:hypothetical protein
MATLPAAPAAVVRPVRPAVESADERSRKLAHLVPETIYFDSTYEDD